MSEEDKKKRYAAVKLWVESYRAAKVEAAVEGKTLVEWMDEVIRERVERRRKEQG